MLTQNFVHAFSNALSCFTYINFLIVYVKNRFTRESGRLIPDLTEIGNWFNIERYLGTMDIRFSKFFLEKVRFWQK